MTTAGTAAGEIEKPGTTAAAATKDAAAATTTDKAQTTVADTAAAKPNGADPADKGTGGAPADGKAVAKPAASLLDDAGEDDEEGEGADTATPEGDKKPAVAGEFPDDWREKLAKGDDKKLTRLKRYKSYEDFANAGLAAQDKIRSGDYKPKLADDATPEEKSAWRKENGIPDEPAKYETAVPNYKWTDADAPILDGFKSMAHGADLSQPQVTKVLGYYAGLIEEAKERHVETQRDKDISDKQAVEDTLRAKLGGEYRPSLQLFNRLLKDQEVFPDGMADKLASARFADGTRVINDPVMADFFIGLARDRYGEGSLISGDAKQAMTNIEEQARKVMKEDIDKYYAEGWDKKLAEVLTKKEGRGRAA